MPAPLDEAERARRLGALRAGDAAGIPRAEVARRLGLKPNTFTNWIAAEGLASAPVPERPAVPAPPPAERHDAAFWRREAAGLRREVERLSRVAEELSGLGRIPVSVPDWLAPAAGPRRRAVLVVHTSDWHMGEVIAPGEIQGVNAFDPAICAARLRRLAFAAQEMGARWMADCEPAGVLFTLAGDLISGDIHDELARTNALTSLEQVREAAEVGAGMIRALLEIAGRVHVVAVPGNHGRTTHKPTAKLYGRLSYDVAIADRIADRFRDDPRVTWQADGSTDQFVPILGRRVMVTHGDKLGTGGGKGFIGAVAPMMRGVHKTRAQQAALDAPPDLILAGHFHTSAELPGALFNGSVPGWSEYGRDIRGGVEPPKQWLALLTERWGLRERCDVQLEEPRERPKPRIRVPVQMAKA